MQKSYGFTLVELLVAVAIIGIITVAILPQFSTFNKGQTLQNEAARLQTALRVAQNNATSGLKCNTTTGALSWKVYLSTYTYTTSSICGGTISPTPTGTSTSYTFPGITLSKIVISSITFDTCANNVIYQGASVVFSNISGQVSFETVGCPANSLASASKMTITLRSTDTNPYTYKDVVIERGGGIYVKSN